MVRSLLVAALVTAGVAVPVGAAHAHSGGGEAAQSDAASGMVQMHELMQEGNPGMARMHELMEQGNPGMAQMCDRMHTGTAGHD